MINKSQAQVSQQIRKEEAEEKKVPLNSRLSIRTNAIDWFLIAPNVTLEWDVSPSLYNRTTASLGIKGNWNTHQKYKPSTVYNFWDLRGEVRYYWRTEKKQVIEGKSKSSFGEWIKEDVFSKRKANPRYWRAYYVGGYVDGGNYSFKFSKEGIQGSFYGIGIFTGFGIPLYGYNNKFVDLEIGGSLGIVATKYEKYTHDHISNCYIYIEDSRKSLHILPYPVINDLRVGFVFRFASIKDKYKLVNHVKVMERQEQKREKLTQKQEKITQRENLKQESKLQREKEKENLKKLKEAEERERKENKQNKKTNTNRLTKIKQREFSK